MGAAFVRQSEERRGKQDAIPRRAPREAARTPRRAAVPVVQAHLRVGAVNDPLEREAEDVMRRVVASLALGNGGPVGGATDDAGPRRVSRSTPGRQAVTPVAGPITRIRRSAAATVSSPSIGAAGGGLDGETESMLNAEIGRGRKLDAPVRRALEPRFGHDFGSVRVHHDGRAQELNARMSAEAFTVGSDIFFSRPAPDLSTRAGQGLLAHELTHVVQQAGTVGRRMAGVNGDVNDAKRRNAEGGDPKSDRR